MGEPSKLSESFNLTLLPQGLQKGGGGGGERMRFGGGGVGAG